MSRVGTKTAAGRVQPLPVHIERQIRNFISQTIVINKSPTAQERFAKRMRRKDHKVSGVLNVFGNHHKDCKHEERMVIEKYTNGGTTTDLCFGCGSTLTVEHYPVLTNSNKVKESVKIEEGYGKFYPSQFTKKIYRALLDLKEEGQSNLPCM
tara:strand:+ start:1515 stop:1970 length:456 start_codon:yes stop_codon:yes gene_type:complete